MISKPFVILWSQVTSSTQVELKTTMGKHVVEIPLESFLYFQPNIWSTRRFLGISLSIFNVIIWQRKLISYHDNQWNVKPNMSNFVVSTTHACWWPGTVMVKFGFHLYTWPGPRFNTKMSSYQYRKSHCGDKMVVRSSYLHNGIFYTGKMASLYWTSPSTLRVEISYENNKETSHIHLEKVLLKCLWCYY